jgi:hypothetical protein
MFPLSEGDVRKTFFYFGCVKLLIATQATQMMTLPPIGDKMSAHVMIVVINWNDFVRRNKSQGQGSQLT